jgi:hypothetical protein
MRRVLQAIDTHLTEYRTAPFFGRLRDTGIDPRQRLSFAPSVVHYVMSFADLYTLVLREEPPRDELQRLINAQTREDENHWQWFLKDLDTLDEDPAVPFTDAVRFVWSDATIQMRLLTYQLCRLGFGADSLRKLVLIHVIEATGKAVIETLADVGQEFGAATGRRLVFLGPHHVEAEDSHTLEGPSVQNAIASIQVADERMPELLMLVEESFRYFRAFVDEMHASATNGRRLGSGGSRLGEAHA